MTMSNLSQISYSPFRGKTTPSRSGNQYGQISQRSFDQKDEVEKEGQGNLDTINVVAAHGEGVEFTK